MARKWAAAVNRHGGDATVVHLPEVGIRGDTHFPFSDLNNLEIADLLPNGCTRRAWTSQRRRPNAKENHHERQHQEQDQR